MAHKKKEDKPEAVICVRCGEDIGKEDDAGLNGCGVDTCEFESSALCPDCLDNHFCGGG